MGVASTLMSRFCRILPPVTIITICFYFLIKLSLVSNTAVPDPEKWENHALDFVEEDEEGYIPTFETTAIPTPRQTSAAHIEDLENKGEIGDFADDDEFLPFVDIEDDGDWDEEDLQDMSGGKYENETVDDGGDWSRFAYIQYVTNEDYLCNSVMIFEALHRLGSKADRLLMYPQEMLDPEAEYASSHGGKLLIRARDEYNVTLQPIEIQHRDGQDETWADSFTKLLAFNQTQYERVLSLDSDSTVLQHMDELFELPPCPVAMPRAYWLYNDNPPKKILSSQLMLIQPDEVEFERIVQKMNNIGPNDYDMEIVNSLYLDSALILPHRKYDMLTAEFRAKDHSAYLGSEREQWDPNAVLNEAKFVHFSDWPVPKPWINDPEVRLQNQPDCATNETTCAEREIWNGFYTDFRDNREEQHPFYDSFKSYIDLSSLSTLSPTKAEVKEADKRVAEHLASKARSAKPLADILEEEAAADGDEPDDAHDNGPTDIDDDAQEAEEAEEAEEVEDSNLGLPHLRTRGKRKFKRSDKRRCILATNVAEAGILIDGVVYVVVIKDLGYLPGLYSEKYGPMSENNDINGSNTHGIFHPSFMGETPPPGLLRLKEVWERDKAPIWMLHPDIYRAAGQRHHWGSNLSLWVVRPIFHPRLGCDILTKKTISKASARLLAGRAGRSSPRTCHRMYTKKDFYEIFLPSTPPAILKSDLAEMVLLLKALGFHDVVNFDFVDPPHPEPIFRAFEDLFWMGFVDEDGSITIKGKMAAKLPFHPAWYNTFAEALSLGCSDEMVTIAATESTQQPMFLPPQPFRYTRDLAHRRFHCPVSDQMSLMNAFHSYIRTKNRFQTLMGKAAADKAVDEWCAHGFLSRDVLEEAIRLRKQLKEFFKSLFDQEPTVSDFLSSEYDVNIRKVLARSFFHRSAIRDPGGSSWYRAVHPHSSLVRSSHK
nr:hypothetical protein FVER53263_11624 [Fusarium verticillioides]